MQLLAPARGAWFRARGHVVRSGRTLSVVSGEMRAFERVREEAGTDEGEVVTLLNGTMMAVRGRPDLAD